MIKDTLNEKYRATYRPYYDQKDRCWKVSFRDRDAEEGCLEYVVGEYARAGLYFPYSTANALDGNGHSHTFEGVMEALLEDPVDFSIQGYEAFYSQQEIEMLETLQSKLRLDREQEKAEEFKGYSTDVEAARQLAEKLHEGQKDKAGLPYITHPERVASRLETPEAQVIGWLHDTVEDTDMTVEGIEARFGHDTAMAVDAVSRREDEPWSDYLERVKQNPMARQVKISDLIDNSNLSRIPHVTMKDVKRQAKYNKALKELLELE